LNKRKWETLELAVFQIIFCSKKNAENAFSRNTQEQYSTMEEHIFYIANKDAKIQLGNYSRNATFSNSL
jgi:hypothetical protein